MEAEWRIVSDYPYYSVSNNGDIRNNKTGRILKPALDSRGLLYLYTKVLYLE
jgi:hypothetical protein